MKATILPESRSSKRARIVEGLEFFLQPIKRVTSFIPGFIPAWTPFGQQQVTMEQRNNVSTFCQSTPISRRVRSNNALASTSSEGAAENEQPSFGDFSSILASEDVGDETNLIINSSSSNSVVEEETLFGREVKNGKNANESQSIVMESLDSFVPATPESSPGSSSENNPGVAPKSQAPVDYSGLQFTQFRDSSHMSIVEEDDDHPPIGQTPILYPSTQLGKVKESITKEFQFESPSSMSFHYIESSSDSLTEEVADAPISEPVPSTSVPKDDYVKRKEELEKVLLNLQTATRISEHLPDSGQRLHRKIESTKAELEAMNTKMANVSIETIDLTGKPSKQKIQATPKIKVIPFFEPRSQIGPADADLLKARADVDQLAKLLTGKMAERRLCELRAVTLDTVRTIHSAMQSCPQETDETAPPNGLTCPLMVHQRQALTWLLWREQQVPNGGILADEMGLGKTLSMLSLVVASNSLSPEKVQSRMSNLEQTARSSGLIPSKSTLIICPASILYQWEAEVKQRLRRGLLRISIHHGQKRENNPSRLAGYDLVLTTYKIVSSGLSKNKKKLEKCDCPLFSILWNRIILDEAHTIKSPSTDTAQACYRLEALSRWALTGTPIHNNVKDLYSLLKFLRFRPFDDNQVWNTWMQVKTDTGLNRIHSVVKSILLRRTKDRLTSAGRPLIPMPPKQMIVRKLALTAVEKDVYAKMFAASRLYVENFLTKGVCMEDEKRHFSRLPQPNYPRNLWGNQHAPTTQGSGNIQIIVMLLRLRQACCHMALVKQAVDLDALKGESIDMDFEKQFKELSLVEDYEDIGSHAVDQLFTESFQSCKVKALIETIQDVQKAEKQEHPKFVIVSQWVSLLKIISHHLRENGITFTSITSKVTPEERTKRVERFNSLSSDPNVMLLSLTAGGVGLNLIGGNHLFILDLHWNPALELQAADRIHRVGQRRPVFIHKLVCVDTIEEKVLDLQQQKLQLAHSVLTGVASNSMQKLSFNDLRFLFELEKGPSASADSQLRRRPFLQ